MSRLNYSTTSLHIPFRSAFEAMTFASKFEGERLRVQDLDLELQDLCEHFLIHYVVKVEDILPVFEELRINNNLEGLESLISLEWLEVLYLRGTFPEGVSADWVRANYNKKFAVSDINFASKTFVVSRNRVRRFFCISEGSLLDVVSPTMGILLLPRGS